MVCSSFIYTLDELNRMCDEGLVRALGGVWQFTIRLKP